MPQPASSVAAPSLAPQALPRPNAMGRGRFVAALAGTAALLTVMVGVEVVQPTLRLRLAAPGLDLVIGTIELVVTALVAALAWARFEDDEDPAALFEAAAFAALATAGALGLLAIVPGIGTASGTATNVNEATVFWTATRAIAASLLVCTGAALVGRIGQPGLRLAALAVLVPGVAVLLLAAIAQRLAPMLPGLILRGPGASLEATGGDVILQVVIGTGFLAGAGLAARAHVARPSIGTAALAFGLVLAAFSQFHEAVDATTLSPVVCTGDLLRLGFDGVLLLGILAQRRKDLRDLRTAYGDLGRLHALDVENRTLEERNRAARAVHDGVVQDLWLLKLKLEQPAAKTGRTGADVIELIDRSIAEARRTISALRGARSIGASFEAAVRDAVANLEGATGIRGELDLRDPGLPDATESELLGILSEALSNVARHADATVVRVRLLDARDQLTLEIADNGVGFDPAHPAEGFGLESMRGRAAALGGRIEIRSAMEEGTTVRAVLPR